MSDLTEIRDGIADLIEDPMWGYGEIITDRGMDFTNGETAELVFRLDDERYELRIRKL